MFTLEKRNNQKCFLLFFLLMPVSIGAKQQTL